MKHSIKKIEESKVEAVVEVEPELWKNAQKKAFEKLAGQVTVPGFRKGKAPEDMLKGKIDPNKIFDEAINDLLPSVFGELVNDEKLRPFSRPEVNVTKLSDSELEIKFVITLVPEVTLGAYKDLHAEKKAPAVTDDEVNEAVKKRLEQSANLVVVDRPAKEGDTVTLDFEGFVDEKPFEGGKAENYALELGSHSFVPGFEEALVGVKSGDSKDVKVTFPKNYVENLAGKEATFKCKIHEIKEKQIPTLSDETVKDMGIKDVATVDQLKEFEKKTLLEGKVNEAQKAYYDAIIKQIRDGAKVTIAKEIIKSEAASMEDNMKKQVEQNGLTFDQYLQITGQKIEDLQAKMESDAEQNIKTYLCLEQIADQEKLSVEDKDVDAEIEKIAKQYNMKPEEVRDVLAKNLNQFKEELRQRKIQDFILANNH